MVPWNFSLPIAEKFETLPRAPIREPAVDRRPEKKDLHCCLAACIRVY
jgi:hypothetical protein